MGVYVIESFVRDGQDRWTRDVRVRSAIASLIVAVIMLVGSAPRSASAVLTVPPAFTAPIQAAGLTETWTIGGWQGSRSDNLTSITVVFPTGFVIPPNPTVTVTASGLRCTVVRATTTGGSVVIETSGACSSSGVPPQQSVTIADITNPTAPGTNAASGFKLATSVDPEQFSTSAVVIWGMTASPVVCDPDGFPGMAQVRFTTTGATTAGNTGSGSAQALMLATNLGAFVQPPSITGALGAPFPIEPGATSGVTTVAGSISAGATLVANMVASFVVPALTGTATVTVRVIPPTGGTPVLLGSSEVTFASGVCVPPGAVPPVVTPPVVTPPPMAAPATFTGGAIAPSGISLVSFTGTTAELNAAGVALKVISVTATVRGQMVTFIVGASDFVNAEFNTVFSVKGLSNALVIVRT